MLSTQFLPVRSLMPSADTPSDAEIVRSERREQKRLVAQELLGVPPERAESLLLHRAIAAFPRRAMPRYTLSELDIETCDRIGDDLMRIALTRGRQFFGRRSERAEYLLHHFLKARVPPQVSADGYKLAIDIQTRYLGAKLRWYLGRGRGVYIEGGCYTGLKAIKWRDTFGPGARILAVEIGASNHELLRMNVEANGLQDSIVPVHAGLWHESGHGTQRHSFTTKRFLEATDRWKNDLVYEEPVRLLAVEDLLDEHDVAVAEYLNVQVNGAELHVLDGIQDLARVKVIDVAAYYTQDGVSQLDLVREKMTARGCRVVAENAAGRIAFATPKYIDEVLALRP